MGVMSHVEGSQFPPANLFNNCGLKNCDMQEEIWKDVVGYEGLYQVSNLGRVKSLDRKIYFKMPFYPYSNSVRVSRGRILKNPINTAGYPEVRLSKNGNYRTCTVHRLKAEAFIPNPENKRTVNHRDGIKSNNGYHIDGKDNLEWATDSENITHAYRELGAKSALTGKFGSKNPFSKSIIQYTKDGKFIAEYDSMSEAQRKTGIRQGNISSCCCMRPGCKTAGGFIWKFKKQM